jgi:hypothetical protein
LRTSRDLEQIFPKKDGKFVIPQELADIVEGIYEDSAKDLILY